MIDYKSIEIASQGLKAIALIKFGESKLLPNDKRVIVNNRIINNVLKEFSGIPYQGGHELFYNCRVILLNALYSYLMDYITIEELDSIHKKYRNHIKIFYYNVYKYDKQLCR